MNVFVATDQSWHRLWTVGIGCAGPKPDAYVFDTSRADQSRHKVEFVTTDASGEARLTLQRRGKTQHVICQVEATFPAEKGGELGSGARNTAH